jgi:hypothetical protein
MEIGELVSVIVDIDSDHSEQTCPWHEEREPAGGELDAADKEEDVPPPGLPENDGGKLGRNLGSKPEGLQISVPYTGKMHQVSGREKPIAQYEKDESADPYDVVFSAHHIIPGNESLKGHPVLRWVGDAGSLGEYGKGVTSELADGEYIGYDINAAVNGVWLPGPYALSTIGKWTDKRLASSTTADFKLAYAFAAMDRFGRQFHYRHTDYSDFVIECMKKIDERLESFAPECPVLKDESGEPQKPYRAPPGLVTKLDRVSCRLKPLLDGTRWSPHIYTDGDAGPEYISGAGRRLREL